MTDQPKPLTNREKIRQLTAEAARRKAEASEKGKTPPSPGTPPKPSRIESPAKKGNPPPRKEIGAPSPILLDSKGGPSEGGGEKPPKKKKKWKGRKGRGQENLGRLPHGSTFHIEPWDTINILWKGSLWIPAHKDEGSGKEFGEATFHGEASGVFKLLKKLDLQYRDMIRVPSPEEESPK